MRKYFPSFYRIAASCRRGFGLIRQRFTWAWVKLLCVLGAGLVWIGLWVDSHTWHQYAGDEFALGVRGAGFLAQTTSYPGTLHLQVMLDRSRPPVMFSSRRLSYLGNGGYRQGYGFAFLGFAFSLMPREFDGGDYRIPPYLAFALPYWFLILVTALAILRYARRSSAPGRVAHRDRSSAT